MIAAGVLVNASHNVCFAHGNADIERVLAAYDHALAAVREALDRGDISQRLGNQVIEANFQYKGDGVTEFSPTWRRRQR